MCGIVYIVVESGVRGVTTTHTRHTRSLLWSVQLPQFVFRFSFTVYQLQDEQYFPKLFVLTSWLIVFVFAGRGYLLQIAK